jgi:isoaspartyl peptidase/L-asparaginase-like protein (Ntn-hydrolase superfamily)
MKDRGRLGDTPVPGSGFYADSDIGAAAATGMGEEIMKGCLSYAAVQNLRTGMNAQEAAETAVKDLHEKLVRKNGSADAMSLICMDREGNWGVGTNVDFPFTVSDDIHGMKTLTARWQEGKVVISEE